MQEQEQYGPFQKSPRGYNQDEYLDKIENTYRAHANFGKSIGMNTASEFLMHYLDGSGTPKTMSRDQARSFNFIKDAEATNQKRFDETAFLGLGAMALYEGKKAKPFDFGSDWQQSLTGVLKITNQKLAVPDFTWEDTE